MIRKAIEHWWAMRATRIATEERYWEYEPTTLRVKIRQAYCILVAHSWTAGVSSDPDEVSDCVFAVDNCGRCGVYRYGDCLTHAGSMEEEDLED